MPKLATRPESAPVVEATPAGDRPATDGQLAEIFARLGDSAIPDTGEWGQLLGITAGTFADAQRGGKLSQISVPSGHHAYRTGYRAKDVLDWIRREHVVWKLTPIAATLISIEVREGIDSEALYDGAQVEKLFGIEVATIEAACRAGKIRSGDTTCSQNRLPGDALIRWIEEDGATPRWSIHVVASVARRRARAEEQECADQDSAASAPPPDVTVKAFDLIGSQNREERRQEQANSNSMLQTYRAILCRRLQPLEGDATTFAELCQQLGYDRDRVDEDIALLDQMGCLLAAAANLTAASDELNIAQSAFDAEMKGRDQRERTLRQNLSTARARQNEASGAPAAIRELREANPALFAE